MTEPTAHNDRPPYGAAAIAGLLVFGLYVLTLAPSTALWDASEYIATAHTLGIPHPPGNSLFVMLGRVWIVLLGFTGLPVAVRMNLLAAATSAGAAFFYFLISHRILTAMVRQRAMALAGAAASVLLSATAYTVWNQSNVNEKVYTISVLVIAAVSWLTIRWIDQKDEPGSERLLLLAGYLMVLGSTNHLMSVLPAPAFLLTVMLVSPVVFLRKSLWVRAVPLILLGLSFNLILPIRAAQDPIINEGDPTCESVVPALVSVWTNGKAGCEALSYNLRREQYQKPPVSQRMAPLNAQLINWYQYFEWQWGRGMEASELPFRAARTPLSLLFLLLGGAGLWAAFKGNRNIGIFLGTLVGLLTFGLVFYLNFKYGYSLNPEFADRAMHEVRERDYFFIAGFGLWGMLSGIGLVWTWTVLQDRFLTGKSPWLASPILVVAFIPMAMNWAWATRSGDYAARDWAYNLLMSVEPYAILFTNGDNDTFPLWYLQEVEGIRQDVTVVVGQYLYTDWYPKQIEEMTRPDRQRPFLPEQGAGIYQDRPMPTRSVTRLTHEEMDRIEGTVLPQDQPVRFPEMNIVYPAGMQLSRASWLGLRFILDSMDERPAYFSSSSGLMNDLGLAEFAIREGLTSRLHVRDLEGEQPEGVLQGIPNFGGEYFDVPRSVTLWDDVYSYRGLRDREIWFDRATLNIPWHFYALALQLSDVIRDHPDYSGRTDEFRAESEAFGLVASGGSRGTPESSLPGGE